MTSLASVAVFATETDTEGSPVITVKYDSETIGFSVFDDGWNHAMEQAETGKEVYVTLWKDWVADDLHIENFYNFKIGKIASPENSIGIRYKNDNGGEVGRYSSFVNDYKIDSFFANNEGMELYRTYKVDKHGYREEFIGMRYPAAVGSIFGEGSLNVIVSIVALVAAFTSIVISVVVLKKIAVPKNRE